MLGARIATLANVTPGTMTIPTTPRIRGWALLKIRERILLRDNGMCRCDDCAASGAVKLAHEVEHRIPLWKGGAEDDSNRYAINRDCHKAKTAREAAERSGIVQSI